MAQHLRCPQGHEWEVSADNPSASACPVCGTNIEMTAEFNAAEDPSGAGAKALNLLPSGPGPVEETASRPSVAGYEVLGELGRGGMGVVYQARQVRLNRLVALKMVLAGTHAGPHELARFRAEAEAVAQVQHPGIVQIHEVGEQDGRPYFCMEFVDGGSLTHKLDGTPWPAHPAARLVEALAHAIGAAHRRGIVHRDLKPANVLLTAEGTPKITDFGLAKRLVGEPGASATGGLTQTGAIVGTPSYMAPEQAGGRTKEVGPAADIYALGAILYELLTGRPPFKAETPLDTVLQVVSEEPVPPSRLQPKLPRDAETICLKCLEKEPPRRYATAEELADDLHRFVQHEPIRAGPTPPWERAAKWARRRPAVAVLSALVLLITALGFGLVTWKWLDADEQRRLAADNAEKQKEAAEKAREAGELAEQRRREAEASAYLNGIGLAHQLWLTGDVVRARQALETCPVPPRRWEWDYLQRLYYAELLTYRGHAGEVIGLALSPTGKYVATAARGKNPEVKVWEAATGKDILQLPCRHDPYESLAFSPGGKHLAWIDNGAVRVHEITTGKEVHVLIQPGLKFRCVAYTRDAEGTRLLAATTELKEESGDMASVWDVEEGREVCRLPSFRAPKGVRLNITGIAISPHGKWLAAAAVDSGVRIGVDGAKPEPAESFRGQVKVWDLKARKEMHTFERFVNQRTNVAFSTGWGIAWGYGADVAFLSLGAESWPRWIRAHQQEVHGVAFSYGGELLASAGDDRTIKVWDVDNDQELLFALRGHIDMVTRVAISTDHRRLASVSNSPFGAKAGKASEVKVWDLAARRDLRTFGGPDARTFRGPPRSPSWCAGVSPDGSHFALVGGKMDREEKPAMMVWDTKADRQVCTLALDGQAAGRGLMLNAAFSPDGGRIALVWGTEVRIHDASTGQELLRFATGGNLNAPQYPYLIFSADGRRLAAPRHPAIPQRMALVEAVIWDADTGKELLVLPLQELVLPLKEPARSAGFVFDLAFSPDSHRLAAALLTKTDTERAPFQSEISVWDAGTGKRLTSFVRDQLLKSVAFSPDGSHLAAAGGELNEGLAVVWDLDTGQEVLVLRGHTKTINSVAFSRDGSRLVTAGSDRTVKLWDTGKGHEVLTLAGHRRAVTHAFFTTDGKRIVSATGLDLMQMSTMGHGPAEVRLPMEVKIWDASR